MLSLLLLTMVWSCKSLEDMSPPELKIEETTKLDFSELGGTYRNSIDTSFGEIEHSPQRGIQEDRLKLCDRLFLFPPDSGYNENVFIKLNFVSKNDATLEVYNQKGILSSKSIKGKFKNGYFYVKPRVYIIPFFPIYYIHSFERVRIGKSKDYLVVDHTMNAWGFALFGGGSDIGRSTSLYQKIKE